MASMNMMEQLEEQPPAKKPRIDKTEEQGDANSNESNLSRSTERNDEDSGTSTTIMDLASSRRPLPLELNCEIFKCLKLPIQKKFIWGLGRGIYGMFGQKLLKKTKRVRNPHGNRCNKTTTIATVAANGLNVSNYTNEFPNVFAVHPFPISGPHCRMDDYPGTILYYYEVKGDMYNVGLSYGAPDNLWIGAFSNSYAISSGHYTADDCLLAGEQHHFELPEGAIRPEPDEKEYGNVFGCGLVLDTQDKLWIFFTLNGQLLGQKIPIRPTVDRLFPAVKMMAPAHVSIEANFGDDPAKPFEYDIHTCPGLELALVFI